MDIKAEIVEDGFISVEFATGRLRHLRATPTLCGGGRVEFDELEMFEGEGPVSALYFSRSWAYRVDTGDGDAPWNVRLSWSDTISDAKDAIAQLREPVLDQPCGV